MLLTRSDSWGALHVAAAGRWAVKGRMLGYNVLPRSAGPADGSSLSMPLLRCCGGHWCSLAVPPDLRGRDGGPHQGRGKVQLAVAWPFLRLPHTAAPAHTRAHAHACRCFSPLILPLIAVVARVGGAGTDEFSRLRLTRWRRENALVHPCSRRSAARRPRSPPPSAASVDRGVFDADAHETGDHWASCAAGPQSAR